MLLENNKRACICLLILDITCSYKFPMTSKCIRTALELIKICPSHLAFLYRVRVAGNFAIVASKGGERIEGCVRRRRANECLNKKLKIRQKLDEKSAKNTDRCPRRRQTISKTCILRSKKCILQGVSVYIKSKDPTNK